MIKGVKITTTSMTTKENNTPVIVVDEIYVESLESAFAISNLLCKSKNISEILIEGFEGKDVLLLE